MNQNNTKEMYVGALGYFSHICGFIVNIMDIIIHKHETITGKLIDKKSWFLFFPVINSSNDLYFKESSLSIFLTIYM